MLYIDGPEAERLARRLAEATGESLTEAVIAALRERLGAVERETAESCLIARAESIQALVAVLPDRDLRTFDEVLGYDDHGLPA